MEDKKIIIAIDGYASTGKSTVARRLAKTLNYRYVDTGAMYRAITLYGLQQKIITPQQVNIPELVTALPNIELNFVIQKVSGNAEIFMNGINVEDQIRTLEVSSFVSPVATIPQVRRKLVEQQQVMGEEKAIVMDGRDIGTVVFPQAELKLFMTATPEDRADRRFKELRTKGEPVTYEAILKNVVDRDKIDSTREDSPLKRAEDAIKIDNSNLSLEAQFEYILSLAKNKIAAGKS